MIQAPRLNEYMSSLSERFGCHVFGTEVVLKENKRMHRFLFIWNSCSVQFAFQVLNNTLYWGWLRNVFVPGVYAGAWYNGLDEKRSIYIGDKCSVLVGMPTVRQLRVKPRK